MERPAGIEPAAPAWEADTRVRFPDPPNAADSKEYYTPPQRDRPLRWAEYFAVALKVWSGFETRDINDRWIVYRLIPRQVALSAA